MNNDLFRFAGTDPYNYDQYLGPLLFKPSSEQMLSRLPVESKSILEVSAGTGQLSRYLRNHFGPEAALIVSDINPDMLEIAKMVVKDSTVEYFLADAQQLPFEKNSFDLVINQYGLMFLPDKQQGFNEAYRVLKPRGHFVFATWNKTADIPILKIIWDDLVAPLFKGDDSSRFLTPFCLHDPDLLNNYLQRAGFTAIHTELVRFEGKAQDARELVRALFLKHPFGREVALKDPSQVDDLAREMEKRIVSQYGKGTIRFELSAIMGSGQK